MNILIKYLVKTVITSYPLNLYPSVLVNIQNHEKRIFQQHC